MTSDQDAIRQLYLEWCGAMNDEEDAASRVALAEDELAQQGIDPSNPPEWLK